MYLLKFIEEFTVEGNSTLIYIEVPERIGFLVYAGGLER